MRDKSHLFQVLETALIDELNAAVGAAKDAASYATDEESRATSKWDTQGLEASYLAAGQAQQAKELEEARQRLRGMLVDLTAAKTHASLGALVGCTIGRSATEFFWLVPDGAGGRELKIGTQTTTCLNAQSPLGRALLGKSAGDDFTLPNGSTGTVQSVS